MQRLEEMTYRDYDWKSRRDTREDERLSKSLLQVKDLKNTTN